MTAAVVDLFADTVYLRLGQNTYSCKVLGVHYRSGTPGVVTMVVVQLQVDNRITPFEVPADLVQRADGTPLIKSNPVVGQATVAGVKIL